MNHLSKINNKQLLENFSLVIAKERTSTSEVISYVGELYKRRLSAELGYSSLFLMLTEKYHYSKSAAYRRIQAAKVFLLFPKVLEYLNQGKTNLVSLSLIESHVTKENGERLIQDILGKNKEEIEYYLANTFSNSRVEKTQDRIRRLPLIKKEATYSHSGNMSDLKGNSKREDGDTASPREKKSEIPGKSLAFSLPAVTSESKEEEIRRVKIEFIADEQIAKKIERAKQILRHKYPQGKLEDIFNEALETLLEKKDPERKIARIEKKETKEILNEPKSNSHTETRYIPQTLRREIWKRDKSKCTFQSKDGRECNEQGMLEVDHEKPWSLGGESTLNNLRLLCRAHNQYRNQKRFG